MDPLSQGFLGASAAQSLSKNTYFFPALILGALSGMAPDLDVFIRSDHDPLLYLEYHRQFTHSLLFIPIGALVCTLFFRIFYRKIPILRMYCYSFLGYATHGLLDACTTYGTQLLWPISNQRFAWNTISIIDPLFTLPLLFLLIISTYKKSTLWAKSSLIYTALYLSFGCIQQQNALHLATKIAISRGHNVNELSVKPSFANLFLWKSIYKHEQKFYVDAVHTIGQGVIFNGENIEKLEVDKHFPWLAKDSQQAKDIERFRWFSNDYLAVDPAQPLRIIDIRYSLLPNRLTGLWGIRLDKNADKKAHVQFENTRAKEEQFTQKKQQFLQMLFSPQKHQTSSL